MDASKERKNQGMVATKLLCDDIRDLERGPRVARRMDGTGDSNRSTKPTKLNLGKTSPNAPNRHQRGQNQKQKYARSRGGNHPSQEET
jgi:hypothetical protein